MIWTMTAIAAGLVVVIAAIGRAVAGRRARRLEAGAALLAAAGDPYGSLYGLSADEAARLHQSAREHGRLHHARWSRDYLPGAGGASLPGRVSGIPRALRVRQ